MACTLESISLSRIAPPSLKGKRNWIVCGGVWLRCGWSERNGRHRAQSVQMVGRALKWCVFVWVAAARRCAKVLILRLKMRQIVRLSRMNDVVVVASAADAQSSAYVDMGTYERTATDFRLSWSVIEIGPVEWLFYIVFLSLIMCFSFHSISFV